MKLDFPDCASWIEINRQAFENNTKIYRKLIRPEQLLGCVLKGNAYGHGFLQVLEVLHNMVDLIFVINPVDAFQIREYEKQSNSVQKRVVVLGSISLQEALKCAEKDIEVVIDGPHWAEYAQAMEMNFAGKPLKAHIHIDTGLGREGFTLENLAEKIEFLKIHQDVLKPIAIMSHFSNVEDVTHQEYAEQQIKKFNQAYDIVVDTTQPSHKLERHIAQSASTAIMPQAQYDLARVGISLYGLWPSSETKISAKVMHQNLPILTPVLSWKCKSQLVKKIPSGSYVGYGCSYKAPRDLRICLLPVGYFDGYPRMLSNKGYVLINEHQCKVLGRVMMNHIVVDVTDTTTDESPVLATLIGTDGDESISVELLAEWAETINYEIVTRIGAHLKRIVVD